MSDTDPKTNMRVTVNLSKRGTEALVATTELTGDNQTDTINRALR